MTRLLLDTTVILISVKVWSIFIVLQHIEYNPSNGLFILAIFVVSNCLHDKAVLVVLCVVEALLQTYFARLRMDFKRDSIFLDAVGNSSFSTAKCFQVFSCEADTMVFFDLKSKSRVLEFQVAGHTI